MANIEKLGSSSPEVLLKNATNLDKLVNGRESESLPDRFGVLRKTWHGMEMIFSRFIAYITGRGEQAVASIGWQELGDWVTGLTVDNRQQIVYYNGAWYKYLGELEHVIAGDSPENDGGVWSAENPTGKWSNIGDAALRSNLGSGEAGLGVNLVYGALKQVSITNFMSSDEIQLLENRVHAVNIDNAITAAKAAGHEHVNLPYGHFGLHDTDDLSNFLVYGSNKTHLPDIKLKTRDGSSGALSLETEGTVLHLTGAAAANGITLSNTGSGYASSLCGIVGCSIYYPEQDWKDWELGTTADIDGDIYYQPTVFPPAFIADKAMRVVFDNVFFINAYHWIDIKDAQLVHFGGIAGSLLNRGYTVTRMGAGGVTENFDSYPYWTWACDFAGISQRVNHYCDAVAKGIQVGLDDGVTRTVEQMRIIHASIIGAADGIICGGKGVSIVDAKIDNV
ncbi:TPA: hypothetical protein ACGA65_005451, partial [Klebsiella quasipneumoniae]